MSIKSIAVLNYTELCSLALIPTINDIVGYKLKYIDIDSKRFKELFYYYLIEEIIPYEKQGLKVVITHSCKLQNNWRFEPNPYNYTFSVVDSTLNITDRDISDTLDAFWKLLCCNSYYNTIRNKELDNDDLTSIITNEIGVSHLVLSNNELDNITDLNMMFPKRDIPKYLVDEVIRVLCNNNLIIR
jgi:hypothetical protein